MKIDLHRTAAFGQDIHVLPGRNFARYLLTIFILFSHIMRTGYQCKQFNFMQMEMREKDVQTIDEMIEKNFTSHIIQQYKPYFESMDFIKRLISSH